MKPGQPEDSLVNDAQADGPAEIVDRECLRVRAHAKGAHAGGGPPDERDWSEWRRSVGDADDGEGVVHAEGLAARTSERPEVDLYAIVPPQVSVRGRLTRGEDPPDDITCVVDVEQIGREHV